MMERLTDKYEADAQRKEYERHLANGYPRDIHVERLLRLAAYEDTHMMPADVMSMRMDMAIITALLHDCDVDRMCELAEADRDGRVVVLPCKVGDTVYCRTYDYNGTVDLGIQPHKVTAIVGYAIARGRYTDVGLPSGQYGVSWFLTREEAEAALEAQKGAEHD